MNSKLEKPVTSADRIFIHLRGAIVEGDIKASSKLNEPELAQRYDVSRAVIREAINRLEACHLVERKANIGARVVALSPKRLVDLFQVREALEGMAARLAAENMSTTEVVALRDLLKLHQNALAQDDNYYQQAGEVDFHYQILLGSKNEQLISVLMDDIYHQVRMYRVQLGMTGPRVGRAFAEHQQIVDAIANGDGEFAEILMRRHIAYTRRWLYQKLTEDHGNNSNEQSI